MEKYNNMNNTPVNPMFAKFDQAVGKTTPTSTNTPVTSRADEIRNLAKTTQAQNSPENHPLQVSNGQPIKAITDAGSNLYDAVKGEGKYTGVDPVVRGVQGATEALSTPIKVAGQVAHAVGNAISPELTKEVETDISKVGEGVSGAISWLGEKFGSNELAQKFVQQHPEATQTIEDWSKIGQAGGETAGNILMAEGGAKGAPKVLEEGKNIVSDTKSLLTDTSPKTLNEKSILDKYNKAIKPSVSGRGTATMAAQADSKVISGIKAINENKSALEFSDADGNIIKGQAPKSVDQMSQAISQTKRSIYEKYDSLAKQAGEKGVTVDAPSIAKELQPIVDSKSLNIANPKAVAYAKDLMDRLTKTGSVDAKTAQEVIQHYNESLKAYYRNPSYDTASQASIDAMVANKFRESLDNGITGATGEQYQALKDQYGALSSMEKDVARRNTVWARQNSVGLADNISNIVSGAELLKGLVKLSPADIAVSGGIKGIQKYIKYLNNPDVGVSKIFSEIEKSDLPSTGSKLGSGAEDIKSDSSTKPTTFVPKSQTGKALQTMAKNYKDMPNKQGGFVSIGGKASDIATGKVSKSSLSKIPKEIRQEVSDAYDFLNKVGAKEKNININMQEDINTFLKKVEDGSAGHEDLAEAVRIQRYLRNEPVSVKVKSSKFLQDTATGRMKGSNKS